MEGVIHCNSLASIQGCKGFASFVCLWLGGIRAGINSFMNLESCWVSVADSGRNGGPNLSLVQELSRWWELGINGCSSEHQKGKLWISNTVLSTLECMLHRFYTCLIESIWLQVVWAWGLMCDTPRGAELSELCTCILWAIVRVESFRNSMLWEHLFEQWDDFDSVALARWEASDEDHLWIEVTAYEVVSSFQGEDVCGTHLPWAGWSWHRSEGCCSVLGLEHGCRSHIAKLLLLWPCLCPARRHIHKQTTVLWWLLDGIGGAVVGSSPFMMEGWWGLLHIGQGHLQWWGSPNVANMGVTGKWLPWCSWANQWWSCHWECTSWGC